MKGEVVNIAKQDQIRTNTSIRVPQVRLIERDGSQLGVVPTSEAIERAQEAGLDLVEVAPQAAPPVCRIMDFGKYQYEQSKRHKEARRKQKTVEVKQIKLRPKINEHDYQTKFRHLEHFLGKGHKAKVTIMFRGREMAHTELGRKILDRIIKELEDVALVERAPRMEGRDMTMFLQPKA